MNATIISVITQIDNVITDVMVFTENSQAEKYFTNTLKDYESDTNIKTVTQNEIDIALNDGYWIMDDTVFSIGHSTNTVNICGCSTK